MSPDEIRKLLGGYATGTLTEAERKALFAAALDDQELFDELGREQSLKELLELPGARTRLVAALTPPAAAPAWWKKPLPWALAGTLAAGLLVVFALQHGSHTVEVAESKVAPQLEARAKVDQISPAQPTSDREAKPAQSKPLAAPVPLRKQTAEPADSLRRDYASNRVAEAAPPPAPQPVAAPQQALKKEEDVKADARGPALADKVSTEQKDVTVTAEQAKTQTVQSQVPSGLAREQQLSAANNPAVRAQAAPRVAPAASIAGLLAQPRFAFDYTLGRDNLNVRPLATGFLQVTAVATDGRQVVLQPISRLEAGGSVNIAVPVGSTTLTVDFSAKPLAGSALNGIAAGAAFGGRQRAAKIASKDSVAASKQKTGRVEEPLPAPDPHVSITLRVPAE